MTKKILLFCLLSALALAGDFVGQKYQSQKRSAKIDQIWNQVIQDTTPAKYPNIAGLLVESMNPTLDYTSDQLPEGRKKFVHSVGSVVKAEFVPQANNYTGFFQGADSLLIRFSLAKEADYSNTSASAAYDNFVPAIGFKYLIDGKPSANGFAMHGVNGVYSYNFFDQNFNTHIPQPQGLQLTVVAQKFSQGSEIVQFLGLSKFSEYTQDGKAVPQPSFPYMLTFKPNPQVKNQFSSNFTEDFKNQLSKIPAGTTLFEVFATKSPTQTCQEKIGEIRTTSQITTSYFGDAVLFFQHQYFADDLKYHPEWEPYTPHWKLIGNRNPQKQEAKCPFASLFN